MSQVRVDLLNLVTHWEVCTKFSKYGTGMSTGYGRTRTWRTAVHTTRFLETVLETTNMTHVILRPIGIRVLLLHVVMSLIVILFLLLQIYQKQYLLY